MLQPWRPKYCLLTTKILPNDTVAARDVGIVEEKRRLQGYCRSKGNNGVMFILKAGIYRDSDLETKAL